MELNYSQHNHFKKYMQVSDWIKIGIVWKHLTKLYTPFICHGLYHHINVTNNILSILKNSSIDIPSSSLRLALIAGMLHDLGRSKKIFDDKNYLKILEQEITQYWEDSEVKIIIDLINGHNDINIALANISCSVIFIADKMDFTFQRAFLVQIYDKLIEKDSSSNNSLQNKVTLEMQKKLNYDLNSLKIITDKYPSFSHLLPQLTLQYKNIEEKGNNLLENGLSISQHKYLIKDLLLNEIKYEAKYNQIYNFNIHQKILIHTHAQILLFKSKFIKTILIKLLIYFNNIQKII